MRLILNVLWIILGGGIVIALEYFLAGLILCITVIGIPFGVQCFKLAGLALWPFGKDITAIRQSGVGEAIGCVFNVVWLVVAGIWIFLSHVTLAVGLAVTLIGIPFALQHLKLAMLSLMPFGKDIPDR